MIFLFLLIMSKNYIFSNLVAPLLNGKNIKSLRQTKKSLAGNKKLKEVEDKKILKMMFRTTKEHLKLMRDQGKEWENYPGGQQIEFMICRGAVASTYLKELRRYEKKYYKLKKTKNVKEALNFIKKLKTRYQKSLEKCYGF